MATLDRVVEMQQQNKTDIEITAQLQNEGIAPAEIDDAINQAQIKNAVSPPTQTPPQEMQPSITAQQPAAPEVYPPQAQAPQPEALPQEPEPQQPQQPEQEQPQMQQPQQPQEYYQPTPQAYQDQNYYEPQGSLDSETISEIAEQVATEKLEDYKSKVGDIASFKNQMQNQVNDIDDRLKRIESSIQQLQNAILGKIGEYGENYAMVHKDLDNLHGTVAKLMNPLIDNVNEMKKVSK
ncbi:hypothetical protein HN903_04645 [archaeon]|jgi:hypothetical protein|nr:hypothetical protein [archaeon]MBT7129017.1 hypothetical protein [archaeon]